jgi:hypothetical protein
MHEAPPLRFDRVNNKAHLRLQVPANADATSLHVRMPARLTHATSSKGQVCVENVLVSSWLITCTPSPAGAASACWWPRRSSPAEPTPARKQASLLACNNVAEGYQKQLQPWANNDAAMNCSVLMDACTGSPGRCTYKESTMWLSRAVDPTSLHTMACPVCLVPGSTKCSQ